MSIQRITSWIVLISSFLMGTSLVAQIERPARLVLTQSVTTTEPDEGFGNPTFATVEITGTETLELAAGEYLVVDTFHDASDSPISAVQKLSSGLLVDVGEEALPYVAGEGDVVVGPATCRLFATYRNDPANQTSNFTYVANILITSPITDLGALQPDSLGRLVIPENASGPVTVSLEQSTDLLNWAGVNPGTFDPSEEKRFFRIRATVGQ